MKNIIHYFCILIASLPIIFILSFTARAEEYPEFTGNYITCDNKWCELDKWEFEKMMLQHYENDGWLPIAYGGFFKLPDDIFITKESKPRIFLFSGRTQADPATTALIELAKLPYNNEGVIQLNDQTFKNNMYKDSAIKYNKENVKTEMWTFIREIPLRFKPIEGMQGAYLYEPTENLTEGIYVIERGIAKANGHEGLATAPKEWDYHKMKAVQGGLVFIVGKLNDKYISSSSNISDTGSNQNDQQKSQPKDIGTVITDSIIDGLFKK